MKRQKYYSEISENLEILVNRIKVNAKLNILDLNIHAETFYRDLINIVYGYKFQSANLSSANVEAIDLVDSENEVLIQVSSTSTKQKIQDTLKKDKIDEYAQKGYQLKFIFIAHESKNLRTMKYNNPFKIKFDPKQDIIDKVSLLTAISQLEIGRLNLVYDLFKKEFGSAIVPEKISSNLTTIVNLLSEEDLGEEEIPANLHLYKIDEKIKFNELEIIKETTIDEYIPYYGKLDKIYAIFNQQGNNKTISVFRKIKSFYEKEVLNGGTDNIDKFLNIINNIVNHIIESNNLENFEEEVIEMCVKIIVVDAFIRCKIFKNPRGYSHVIA